MRGSFGEWQRARPSSQTYAGTGTLRYQWCPFNLVQPARAGSSDVMLPEQPRYPPEQRWPGTMVSCGKLSCEPLDGGASCPIFAIPTIR